MRSTRRRPASDAIEEFGERLGRPPLVIHTRHISPRSPYLAEGEWWIDALAAHPVDPTFFRRWFDDARRWGVCAIEQDWMLMYWFGVRALRAAPDRAADWQRTLDALAAESGVELIWCMATPADLVLAATLDHVVAVRTSDDYRFAADPALLWTWYLTVNRIGGVLDLPAFKDCFFSRRPPDGADPIDGDEHAELEALLACMSAGPVGIGDRVGCTDREVVLRTCDDDGRIRHVDRPLALIDACLFGEPARGERLAWATTTATRDGRRGPTSSPSTPRPTGASSPTSSRWPTSGSPARRGVRLAARPDRRRWARSPSSWPRGTGHCGSARRPASAPTPATCEVRHGRVGPP